MSRPQNKALQNPVKYMMILGFFIFVLTSYFQIKNSPIYFVADFSTNVGGMAQLFTDLGRGINEQDSSRVQLQNRKTRQVIKLALPHTQINSIRFDPSHLQGSFHIYGLSIQDEKGKFIRRFPLRDIRVLNASKVKTSNNRAIIRMEKNDSDLIIQFPDFRPMYINGFLSAKATMAMIAVKLFLIVFFGISLILFAAEKPWSLENLPVIIRKAINHPILWIPFIGGITFSNVSLMSDRWNVELMIAKNILGGFGMVLDPGSPPALWRPPLPSLLLVPIEYFIEDPNLVFRIFITILVIAFFCTIFYFLRRNFGVVLANLLTPMIFSMPIFLTLPFYQTIFGAMLSLPLIALSLLLFQQLKERGRKGTSLGLGAVFGLLAITRPEGVIYFTLTIPLVFVSNALSWKNKAIGVLLLCVGFGLFYIPKTITYETWKKDYQLIGATSLETCFAGELHAKRVPVPPGTDMDGEGYRYMVEKYGPTSDYHHSLLRFISKHPAKVMERFMWNISPYWNMFLNNIRWDLAFFLVLLPFIFFWSETSNLTKQKPWELVHLVALFGGSLFFLFFHPDLRYSVSWLLIFSILLCFLGAILSPWVRKLFSRTYHWLGSPDNGMTAGILKIDHLAKYIRSHPTTMALFATLIGMHFIGFDIAPQGQPIEINKVKALAMEFNKLKRDDTEVPTVNIGGPDFNSLDSRFLFSYFTGTGIPWGGSSKTIFRRDLIYSFWPNIPDYFIFPVKEDDSLKSRVLWSGMVEGAGNYMIVKNPR